MIDVPFPGDSAMFGAPDQRSAPSLFRHIHGRCLFEIRLQHEALVQRLNRSHIVVSHESAEFLNLFGGDLDRVVHNDPGDAFRTGWGGEGSRVEVVRFSFWQEVDRIHGLAPIIVDLTDFRGGML